MFHSLAEKSTVLRYHNTYLPLKRSILFYCHLRINYGDFVNVSHKFLFADILFLDPYTSEWLDCRHRGSTLHVASARLL